MWFGVITLFPEMFSALTDQGVVGRAFKNGQAQLSLWNPRDFTEDKHRTVDDRPYGGGPGMLMKVEPLARAIEAAKQASVEVTGGEPAKVVYLSPQGRVVNQALIAKSTQEQGLILICGRYEGIDERLIETLVDEEWSVGDFVLSGGELPAMSVMDAMVRLLPGVLGHDDSAIEDSFSNGRLDWPQYTRPEILDGREVPKVLLSGDHQAIARWRNEQALLKTFEKRPELIDRETLTPDERNLLDAHTADKEIDD